MPEQGAQSSKWLTRYWFLLYATPACDAEQKGGDGQGRISEKGKVQEDRLGNRCSECNVQTDGWT